MTMTSRADPSGQGTWTVQLRRPSAGTEPETFLSEVGVGKTVVRLKEKATVFSQGDPADAVFHVRKGRVKLTIISHSGKEAALGIVSEGQFLGESCLLGEPVHIKSATAMTDCELLRIERDVMMRGLHRDHALAELFLARLLARNISQQENLVDQLLNSAEKRLARVLLLLARVGHDGTPDPAALKISQETLAEMVGTTRPRVSCFMNKFRKSGFLDYGRTGLHVHRTLLNVVLRG